ncbi:MAG: Rid family hydrolase [Streptosporangiaceae bacterium]
MTETRIEYVNLSVWQGERGFSQAVKVPAGRTLLLLAGAGSEAATGTPVAPGDVVAQCRAAWASIGEVLARAGGTVRDIVRVRSYVTDARYLPDVTAVRKEVLGAPPYPPHTFLVVSALAHPQMLVEIEVDAMLDAKVGTA